ncbi:recombinase family protein [Chitinophaga vietnamensis]|uniref:recombinase family protein n=1 Tax=Chitinophaga vietnamensis TaxID=2593957 RepID=UPI0013764379|nr:recombinase family protein [Chitinophaga vietnamensis]
MKDTLLSSIFSDVKLNAIGYIRISIKDQSLYSLEFQTQNIKDYCSRNNINLISIFKDDGEHSDTFDRPDWLALEDFIKKHKGRVNYLIIIDYDRFSRDMAEALIKIRELERKYSVKILSTGEHIDTDTEDPATFLHRAFKLMIANHELINIRKRTRNGMRTARLAGRFVNKAPIGYLNRRDDSDKSMIVVDESKRAIIVRIFNDFVCGLSYPAILKTARMHGFTLKGNSALTRLLTNPVYAGFIKIPATGNQPEKMVKAIHEPIISEVVFWKANEIINGKNKLRSVPNSDVPLRGIIKCTCGSQFTAGYSKGKLKYYLYYRCTTEPGKNFRGDKIHALLLELLEGLSFAPSQLNRVYEKAKSKMDEALKNRKNLLAAKKKEIQELDTKIEAVEDRLMNNEIELTTYKRWYNKLATAKSELINEIEKLSSNVNEKIERLERAIPYLCNLKALYENLGLPGKQKLLNGVFKVALVFDGERFRTPFLHPALMYNYMKVNEKGLLLIEQPSLDSAMNPVCTPDGS